MGKKRKQAKMQKVKSSKYVVTKSNPESCAKETPIWSFARCDNEGEWCIGQPMKQESFWKEIIPKLNLYETMIWAEIDASSGAKQSGRGSMNHFVSYDGLTTAGSKRYRELKIQEDELYSLTLRGSHKLLGIRSGRKFSLVWYDPNHEIVKQKR